ncbi:hypothetical protein SDC9_98796 [bioreactor metagenome]|uniref:Uncharacterized protein n=1 Tax=bioreactor metagenome TaxID=1076179 RepID=A0A645AMI6_9ZZZZ
MPSTRNSNPFPLSSNNPMVGLFKSSIFFSASHSNTSRPRLRYWLCQLGLNSLNGRSRSQNGSPKIPSAVLTCQLFPPIAGNEKNAYSGFNRPESAALTRTDSRSQCHSIRNVSLPICSMDTILIAFLLFSTVTSSGRMAATFSGKTSSFSVSVTLEPEAANDFNMPYSRLRTRRYAGA